MVYAGYVPAKVAQSSWTPLELALKQVSGATAMETLAVLKMVRVWWLVLRAAPRGVAHLP
jgi:hypothetical protein